MMNEIDFLIKEVLKKQDRIIPIVGDECFVGLTKENKILPLQQWIAEEVLGEDVDARSIYLEGYRGLDILFEKYKQMKGDDSFVSYKEEITSCVEEGITERRVFLRKDVKDFLLAGKFEVIVTTCPYHILEKELMFGEKPYNVTSFAPIVYRRVAARASNDSSKSEAILVIPAIYQIFGDCEGEFVSGEEDLLKFLHYLNQTDTEKGFGASPLVKYIKDKGQDNKGLGLLMPIGCSNLPNWIFRFLWYPFSQERIIGKDKNNQGGIWPKHISDSNFYRFLRNYRFKTLSQPTKGQFIDNVVDPVLAKITEAFWNKRSSLQEYASSKLQVKWGDNEEWDWFISYASEDVDFAQKVYDVLTKSYRQKVWMDRRGNIVPGEEYWTAIQHGIEHSHKFIFIITNNYLRKAIEKNHRDDTGDVLPTGVYQEIERIKQYFLLKKRDGERGYAFPLILEETKVTYTDYKGILHRDESLCNGLLEKLPKYKEYEMLQTDVLFYHIQELVCNENNLEDKLKEIFY